MIITLVRHAPTKDNFGSVYMGQKDIAPDSRWLQHYMDTTPPLVGCWAAAYCSPLSRASASAQALRAKVTWIADNRLMERDMGSWVGCSKAAMQRQFPSAFVGDGALDFTYPIPQAEPFAHVVQRVAAWVADCMARYGTNCRVLAVSHNGAITALRCLALHSLTPAKTMEFWPHLTPRNLDMGTDLAYLQAVASGAITLI